MERLRSAIEQARQTRSENAAAVANLKADRNETVVEEVVAPEAPSPVEEAEAPSTTPAVDARWEGLPIVQLKSSKLRRNRLVGRETKGPDRAAFDMLRTRLLTLTKKENWTRIAITSPTMSCGKSTTALNIAIALSRLSDVRTMVFETDMRRPSMAKMLGLRGKSSVFDVLSGSTDIAEQAVRIAPNVALSLNHGIARNPAEILHRARTSDILDRIQEQYQPDVMLFDMPPMLQSDDTLGFVNNVDCAVLVALAETTTLDQVDFCEGELSAHTNVAGVVLNRCRYVGGGYGYGYGYGDY